MVCGGGVVVCGGGVVGCGAAVGVRSQAVPAPLRAVCGCERVAQRDSSYFGWDLATAGWNGTSSSFPRHDERRAICTRCWLWGHPAPNLPLKCALGRGSNGQS